MKALVPNRSGFFLAKTDPETYSIEQLEREGETVAILLRRSHSREHRARPQERRRLAGHEQIRGFLPAAFSG